MEKVSHGDFSITEGDVDNVKKVFLIQTDTSVFVKCNNKFLKETLNEN